MFSFSQFMRTCFYFSCCESSDQLTHSYLGIRLQNGKFMSHFNPLFDKTMFLLYKLNIWFWTYKDQAINKVSFNDSTLQMPWSLNTLTLIMPISNTPIHQLLTFIPLCICFSSCIFQLSGNFQAPSFLVTHLLDG